MLERNQLNTQAGGDAASASEALFSRVYDELRRIAALQLSREPAGQTLQPTALVHEAWIRLSAGDARCWKSQIQFVAAASEAMRRILVDRARAKLRLKRGRRSEHVMLDEAMVETPESEQHILEVHHTLEHLERDEPELAEVVRLRFFGGLNHDEIGALLGVHERTIRRRWELARVRLIRRMKEERGSTAEPRPSAPASHPPASFQHGSQ
ncbi:MAG: sigma-70 family RNA polymerase sigma factor [Verrucomicrobiales bacterium]|nr:sigma-70 family RNA polymerase sigma factor [Verrucomicrobiales bacterium]